MQALTTVRSSNLQSSRVVPLASSRRLRRGRTAGALRSSEEATESESEDREEASVDAIRGEVEAAVAFVERVLQRADLGFRPVQIVVL